MVAFGWSVSDIAAGIRIVVRLIEAFDAANGASAKYKQAVDFLKHLKADLEHIKAYVDANTSAKYAPEIATQLSKLDEPFTALEKYLMRYQKSLALQSKGPKRVYGTVWFTLSELSNRVTKLQDAVKRPFELIMPLIALQLLSDFEDMRKSDEVVLASIEKCQHFLVLMHNTGLVDKLDAVHNQQKDSHEKQLAKLDEALSALRIQNASISDLRANTAVSANGIKQILDHSPRQQIVQVDHGSHRDSISPTQMHLSFLRSLGLSIVSATMAGLASAAAVNRWNREAQALAWRKDWLERATIQRPEHPSAGPNITGDLDVQQANPTRVSISSDQEASRATRTETQFLTYAEGPTQPCDYDQPRLEHAIGELYHPEIAEEISASGVDSLSPDTYLSPDTCLSPNTYLSLLSEMEETEDSKKKRRPADHGRFLRGPRRDDGDDGDDFPPGGRDSKGSGSKKDGSGRRDGGGSGSAGAASTAGSSQQPRKYRPSKLPLDIWSHVIRGRLADAMVHQSLATARTIQPPQVWVC